MKISLVTTTINTPILLEKYINDAKKYNFDIDVIVIGDKKTHQDAEPFCQNLNKNSDVSVRYYNPEKQIAYLKNFPELSSFLPWNCIQRRNLAVLMAYSEGSDIIVTIDDDNYIAQENYFKGHAHVGQHTSLPSIHSDSGWYNICESLEDINGRQFFPRGYPVSERVNSFQKVTEDIKTGRTVVNGGFWLGDPDIDAVTRLAAPIDVQAYKRKENYTLAINTWAPFNSQNTAIHRDCIPAYFLCSDIGRFDDIWASYIVKRIADHLGDYISFGFPLVKQDRNPHDLWVDVAHERLGMQLSDIFCDWLREINLSNNNYYDCAKELINGLKQKLDSNNLELKYEHRSYINQFIDGYNVWFKTIDRICKSSTASSKEELTLADCNY
jgi:hypothetical protein